MAAEGAEVVGQGSGDGDGLGVVGAEAPQVEPVGVLQQGAGGLLLAARSQEAGGVVEEPTDLDGDVVQRAAGVRRGQHVRHQPAPRGPGRGVIGVRRHGCAQEAHGPDRPARAVRAVVGAAAHEVGSGHAVELHAVVVGAGQPAVGEDGRDLGGF